MEFIDAKIWISKNASLCRVFANRVTYNNFVVKAASLKDHIGREEYQDDILKDDSP